YPFELQPLPYEYNALEPVISEETLHFHHDKHLAAYVKNLNDALSKSEFFQKQTLDCILCNLETLPQDIKTAVTNNGGGVFNHNFYFSGMTKEFTTKPSKKLEDAIVKTFGSMENFFGEFKKAAMGQFGSGWAWLVCDKCGNLKIVKTANQETPLKDRLKPLLTIDVWEHAYYLDYQNRRADYVDQYFKIINWDRASKIFEEQKDC
ncbi:MAG: superoxide dismutase, partial [Oscillospiraceae bacterium]